MVKYNCSTKTVVFFGFANIMQIISMNIGGYATQFESSLLCIEVRANCATLKERERLPSTQILRKLSYRTFFFEDCQKTRKENLKNKTGTFN